jgi:hypothetical protein
MIWLNKEALAELRCGKEENRAGPLEAVAHFATDWFGRHLYSHSVATD